MSIKLAINGYGRIGRNILKALYESKHNSLFGSSPKIVAINDVGDLKTHAHLTRYDSTHGRFLKKVSIENDCLVVERDSIKVFSERSPDKLPWGELGIDVVLECTGHFATKEKASLHLQAGAKKVLISAPAGEDLPTIVYGINDNTLTIHDKIVSNASCTTNCLVPLVKPLHDVLQVQNGLMTTIHAYTNDQVLSDVYHTDLRRARSAAVSMIPTKTGAAAAIGLVLPELKGKLDGFAMRVPVLNVSIVDLTFSASRETTVEEVNSIVRKAAQGSLKGILEINEEPLVSIDFNHNPASAIFDATQTKVIGNLVKVLAWYDNEWGFSNRMIDTAMVLAKR
jgi:glyceraldehyde 3-phosphate dehydrogenase